MKTLTIGRTALTLAMTFLSAGVPRGLEARYADDFNGHYEDLLCREDDCDCLEPDNNRFQVVSASNRENTGSTVIFTGAFDEVQDFFDAAGRTDGLPIVPPTPLKLEKFMRYTPYAAEDVVATLNGRPTTAYQVAVNAVLSGCSADLMPLCVAIVKAMGDATYLREIADGSRVPLAIVNGPIGRQVDVDSAQGMTTEEVNVCLARFISFALANLADQPRDGGAIFGTIRPLVIAENEAAAVAVGWKPYHVQCGHRLDASTVTMTSFAMWGNNLTPATDWPEEILKIVAWDVTEKNLGALGAADSAAHAATERTILVTPPVAKDLSALYRSKEAFAAELADHARRPMAMRAYAYRACDTEGLRTAGKTQKEVYDLLVARPEEDARITTAPAWLNGITNPKIMTGASVKAENVRIVVTGDASRNKTQVMPGGKAVTVELETPDEWEALLKELQRKDAAAVRLTEPVGTPVAPIAVPKGLTDGEYRVLDPATGATYLRRAGALYFDATTMTLHAYPVGATAKREFMLNDEATAAFITFIENIGYNSSFTVKSGRVTDTILRFSSNARKSENNTVALTIGSFGGSVTVSANQTPNSASAGGVAVDGSRVRLSCTVSAFRLDLDGDAVQLGEMSRAGFVTLDGNRVTVDVSAPAGSSAVLGAANGIDGTTRTVTLTLRANGSYDLVYHTADTLSLVDSAVRLIVGKDGSTREIFEKTDLSDVYVLTRFCPAGESAFSVVADDRTVSRTMTIPEAGDYVFRFDRSTQTLTVTRDITRAGVCSGGTVENVAGVYVVHPKSAAESVRLSHLAAEPKVAVAVGDFVIPGEAFAGFGEDAEEGLFSLALKPPVAAGVSIAAPGTDFAVSVGTYANLIYTLQRADVPSGPYAPVGGEKGSAIGTGSTLRLIDGGLNRPKDKAFYRINVNFPSFTFSTEYDKL